MNLFPRTVAVNEQNAVTLVCANLGADGRLGERGVVGAVRKRLPGIGASLAVCRVKYRRYHLSLPSSATSSSADNDPEIESSPALREGCSLPDIVEVKFVKTSEHTLATWASRRHP